MQTNKKQNTEIKTDSSRSLSSVPGSLNSGFTLFYAVLISSLLLAVGLAVLNITYKEFVLSSGARDSETAFYAADSSLECALYWDSASRPFGFYGDSLAEGLAGFWRFEDNQTLPGSEIAVDSSGRGNHGALIDLDTATSWINGYIGDALEFDNNDGYVRTTNMPVSGSDPRTVLFWVYPLSADPTGPVNGSGEWSDTFVEWGSNGAAHRFSIIARDQNYLAVEANSCFFSSTLQLTSSQWNFVAVVVDGSQMSDATVYLNGSSQDFFIDGDGDTNCTLDTGGGSTANGVHIGGTFMELAEGRRVFDGYVDEVRVYDRALTSSEVNAIRNGTILAGFVPPVDPETTPLSCGGEDINNPGSGWWLDDDDTPLGWVVEDLSPDDDGLEYWKTTFDLSFPDGTCGLVEVYKDDVASTTIISRGYNTCDVDNPRRLERAVRARY
ncbi:MAG: hypothetical protein AMXMBFR44_6610 [Candidatus Campbellbacteria bacterium]